MVEALAAGKPVLACAEGGALDIVRDGETGISIGTPTVESVREAIDRLERSVTGFDPLVLRGFAKRFDRANFERRFARAVDEARDRRGDPGPVAPSPAGRDFGETNGAGKSHRVLTGNGKASNGVSNGHGVSNGTA